MARYDGLKLGDSVLVLYDGVKLEDVDQGIIDSYDKVIDKQAYASNEILNSPNGYNLPFSGVEENIGDTGTIVAPVSGSGGGNIISEQDILSGKVNYLNGISSISVGASQVVGSVSPIFTTPGRYKIVLISESASNDTSQDKTISVSLKRNGAIAGTQILFGATNPLDGGDIFCSGVSTNSGETLDTPTQIHFIARDTNQEITANKVIAIIDITQADIDSGNNKLVFKASVPSGGTGILALDEDIGIIKIA